MNMGSSAAGNNGQLTVPPGFRFHPTDEELLYYYLRKKVSYEPIDLDVIREVDLNKLEPWDLKEKCRIGSGPQNEWYFFSHKDKKYPTGTRTNRATAAGFWKATGRDKAIHMSESKRIGMRKTLVFYTGRAPHGQKTDWIMHEYRLDDHDNHHIHQEDGWVVCRVFKKKTHNRGFQSEIANNNKNEVVEEHHHQGHMKAISGSSAPLLVDHHHHHQSKPHHLQQLYDYAFDGSMQLPQLFSPESTAVPSFVSPVAMSLNTMDIECSQNLLRLTSNGCGGVLPVPPSGGDWTFLDKLLTNSHHHHHHHHHHQQHSSSAHTKSNPSSSSDHHHIDTSTTQRLFPFQYLACDSDLLKFSK